jgi:Tfp pilus assembly protein PilV
VKRQDGFTYIEVLVAVVIVTLSVLGIGGMFVTANKSSLSSQRQTNLMEIAQARMDRIHQIVKQKGFSALAMSAYPANPTDATLPSAPSDPNDFVKNNGTSSASYLIEQNFLRTSLGQITSVPTNGEPLEVDTVNGAITPKVTGVTAGNDTATVWTYVTQATIGCTSTCSADDARRVVVAAQLTSGNGRKDIGPSNPVYLTTIVSNPIPSNQPSSSIGLRLGLNIG